MPPTRDIGLNFQTFVFDLDPDSAGMDAWGDESFFFFFSFSLVPSASLISKF